MSLAENLKLLRGKMKLSQYEVAEKLNIKRERYNTWEQGTAKPRFAMLDRLCEFYNISMNDLTDPNFNGEITETYPAHSENEEVDETFIKIEKAYKKMSEAERLKLVKLMEVSFDGIFEEGK